jgi:hypothetical protein
MDAGRERMTGRAMAFRLNRRATSACWILFLAESQTKHNQRQPFLSGTSHNYEEAGEHTAFYSAVMKSADYLTAIVSQKLEA